MPFVKRKGTSSLLGGMAVITLGQVAGQVLSLLAGMLMARFLSKQELGTYRQLLLIFGYGSPIALLGIPSSVYYLINRRGAENRNRQVWQILSLLAVSGALLSICLVLFRTGISEFFGNSSLAAPLAVFSLYTWAEVVGACIYPLLASSGRVTGAALYTAGAGLISIVVALTAVLTKGNVQLMVLVLGTTSSLRLTLGLVSLVKVYGSPVFSSFVKETRNNLEYSLPLAGSDLVSAYSFDVDRVVVARSYSPEVFASYVIGAAEFPLVPMIFGSIKAVTTGEYATHLANGDRESACELWSRVIKLSALLYIPVFVGLLAFGRGVIMLLYGSAYMSSLPFFLIYQALTPLRVLSPTPLLIAGGKSNLLLWGSIGFGVVNGLCNFLFVPFLGPAGAAAITVASTVALSLFHLYSVKSVLGRSWSIVVPWAFLGRTLFLAVGAIIPVAYITEMMGLGILATTIVAATVVPAAYVALLWATRTVPADIVQSIPIPGWLRFAVRIMVGGR